MIGRPRTGPEADRWRTRQSSGGGPIRTVPILLYHSIDDSPPAWIAPFAVRPQVFARQLDTIVGLGYEALTVSTLVDHLATGLSLPERMVVITFDDGFADIA